MHRLVSALLMSALLLVGAMVVAAERAASWSDGVAGASGAIPEHLQKCVEGFEYCKVKVSGCGGCHGDWDAMQYQRQTGPGEPVNVPVVDRISAEILINGNRETWEYTPGSPYLIDILIYPWSKQPVRPAATPEGAVYTKVGFNLNVSGGKFELFPGAAGDPADRQHDKNVRITGGNYSHAGSRNPNARVCGDQTCSPANQRQYGQTVDNESQWRGELTNTGRGSNISLTPASVHKLGDKAAFWYRAKWTAPPRQEPHGVAFVMAFMITNGDGFDSCVHVECNATKGYSDQSHWDWWSYMIPRKIICEKGQNRVECTENVQNDIMPPPPPPNTGGTGGNGDDGGFGGVTPGIGPGAWIVLLSVALVRWRSRPKQPPSG